MRRPLNRETLARVGCRHTDERTPDGALRMPEDVSPEGADESRQQGGQERMVLGPSLDELAGSPLAGPDAPRIEQRDHEYEDGSAHSDVRQETHSRYPPGRCHSQRPARSAARMNTTSVQSLSLNLMHMM